MITEGYVKMQKVEEALDSLLKQGIMDDVMDLYIKQSSRNLQVNRDTEGPDRYVGSDFDGEPTDTRYRIPKTEPKASDELVEETIRNTEIYRRAQLHILEAQRRQVAYGLDKYPEPLNANTWDILETIDHITDESIDKLHYLIMLRIKLEQLLIGLSGEAEPNPYKPDLSIRLCDEEEDVPLSDSEKEHIKTHSDGITASPIISVDGLPNKYTLDGSLKLQELKNNNDSLDSMTYGMKTLMDNGIYGVMKEPTEELDEDIIETLRKESKIAALEKQLYELTRGTRK